MSNQREDDLCVPIYVPLPSPPPPLLLPTEKTAVYVRTEGERNKMADPSGII